MKSRLVNESSGQRTFIIVLDPGEEAFAALNAFAAQHGVVRVSDLKRVDAA